VANDKEAYGAGLAALLEVEKGASESTITSNTGIDPKAPNFRSYASQVKSQGADCFFFAGIVVERRGPAHQGRQRSSAERQDLRRRRGLHELVHECEKDGGVPPASLR
jgi:hypothetical protein